MCETCNTHEEDEKYVQETYVERPLRRAKNR
jgi:hypothetical protein